MMTDGDNSTLRQHQQRIHDEQLMKKMKLFIFLWRHRKQKNENKKQKTHSFRHLCHANTSDCRGSRPQSHRSTASHGGILRPGQMSWCRVFVFVRRLECVDGCDVECVDVCDVECVDGCDGCTRMWMLDVNCAESEKQNVLGIREKTNGRRRRPREWSELGEFQGRMDGTSDGWTARWMALFFFLSRFWWMHEQLIESMIDGADEWEGEWMDEWMVEWVN